MRSHLANALVSRAAMALGLVATVALLIAALSGHGNAQAAPAEEAPEAPQYAEGNECTVDIGTQNICYEVTAPASGDPAWKQGLSLNVDHQVLGGEVIAYQIRWFNGNWSGWYAPGYNDIDWVMNANNGLRRVWSYFFDHEHRYIICE